MFSDASLYPLSLRSFPCDKKIQMPYQKLYYHINALYLTYLNYAEASSQKSPYFSVHSVTPFASGFRI